MDFRARDEKPLMGDKLTLREYLNNPIMELVNHPDFNEDFFWLAAKLNDAPMRELDLKIDKEWLDRITE